MNCPHYFFFSPSRRFFLSWLSSFFFSHPVVVASFLQSPSLSFSLLNCFNRIFCRPLTHTSRNNPPKQPLRTISSMRSIFLLRSACFASLTSYSVRTNWSASLMKYNRTMQFFCCSHFNRKDFSIRVPNTAWPSQRKKYLLTFSFTFFFYFVSH